MNTKELIGKNEYSPQLLPPRGNSFLFYLFFLTVVSVPLFYSMRICLRTGIIASHVPADFVLRVWVSYPPGLTVPATSMPPFRQK